MTRLTLDYKSINRTTLAPTEDTEYVIRYEPDGEQSQKSLTLNLAVPNVACRILCFYKAYESKVFDFSTTVIHLAVNTSSETLIKGVLYDGGTSKYIGKIIIDKVAQGSSARLEDKLLVVGEGTRNHTEPILQIDANEVTASHASSTGRVDEAQLYYLQSRGLSKKESEDLLVEAFLNPGGV